MKQVNNTRNIVSTTNYFKCYFICQLDHFIKQYPKQMSDIIVQNKLINWKNVKKKF